MANRKVGFNAEARLTTNTEHYLVGFHPTLPLFALLSPDNRVTVHDTTNGKLLQNFPTLNLPAPGASLLWCKTEGTSKVGRRTCFPDRFVLFSLLSTF
jgi:hypothetical protein